MKDRYSQDKEGSLVIKDVVDADGGKYKCEAQNSIGDDEKEESATVYGMFFTIYQS